MKKAQGYGLEGIAMMGLGAGIAQIMIGNKVAIIVTIIILTVAGIGYAIWRHYHE